MCGVVVGAPSLSFFAKLRWRFRPQSFDCRCSAKEMIRYDDGWLVLKMLRGMLHERMEDGKEEGRGVVWRGVA